MYGERKWSGVSGSITLEIYRKVDDNDKPIEPETWVVVDEEKPLPQILVDEIKTLFPEQYKIKQAWFEVVIEFESSGYYKPAKIYGLPENCYPEEGCDERIVEQVMIYPESGVGLGYEKKGKAVSVAVQNELEGLYQEEINDKELEYDEDDGPEYDWA
jgi:hypothetical protein